MNKQRCPVFVVRVSISSSLYICARLTPCPAASYYESSLFVSFAQWTPEGRRLLTGNSNGEMTLWNGLMANFETITQAHETAVRCMKWSNDHAWMATVRPWSMKIMPAAPVFSALLVF